MDMTTNDQLKKAMEERAFPEITRLIAAGGDPNSFLDHSFTLLHLAVAFEQTDLAQALIGAGAQLDVRDARNDMPLHLAATIGNLALCRMLLDAGARTNDDSGNTVLHTQGVHPAVLPMLINAGVDVNAHDHSGLTPLLYAMMPCGRTEMVPALLTAGARVDTRGPMGETALHVAAFFNSPEAGALLLDAGADIDAVDLNGRTALHVAVTTHHITMAELLLKRGARTDIRDRHGSLPLHRARTDALFLALLNAGVDPHMGLEDGKTHTPFQTAVEWDFRQSVAACLARPDTDLSQKTPDGRSLATLAKSSSKAMREMIAAAMDKAKPAAALVPQSPVVEAAFLAMLNAGENPHVGLADCGNLTPFQLAVEAGMIQSVAACLARRDTDLSQKTPDGRSLMDLAIESRNPDLRELIAAAMAKAELATGAAPAFAAPAGQHGACSVCNGNNPMNCGHCEGMGIEPRKIVGYGDCRCVLSQYCDGTCNPIWADQVANGSREGASDELPRKAYTNGVRDMPDETAPPAPEPAAAPLGANVTTSMPRGPRR